MQTEPFYVKNVLELKTTKGDSYLILDLINQDKVRFRGVVWKPLSVVAAGEDPIKENNVYVFDADIQDYKGEKQFNIVWAEKMDLDKSDFIEVTQLDTSVLKKRLFGVLSNIKSFSYRAIVKNVLALEDGIILKKLESLPKTINYDYSYPGGLLLNIVYQMELADRIASTLLEGNPDFEESKDLLICAAFVCDLGKINEIDVTNIKTVEGDLLGHQYLSCNILARVDELTNHEYHEQILKLLHCVLVHHSTDYNNWTPVKIKLIEAELLRHITHMVFRTEEWRIKKN